MRFALLALIALTFPLFVAWLRTQKGSRDRALFLLGLMVFIAGSLKIDGALITWPLWTGTARGIVVSVADMLALALVVTRTRLPSMLPFKGVLTFYGAMIALSLFVSRMPIASTFTLWDYARGMLALSAVGGEMMRPGAYGALARGLSAGLILQAGYVIQQKLGGAVQATGTLAHQNLLGVMAEIALLNILAAVLEGNKGWLLRLGLLAGALILAGGGSRGALGVAGGGAAILIALSLIRRQTAEKWRIVAVGILLMAIAAPIASLTLKERFGNASMLTQEDQRAAMERAAQAMARDNPMGVGANLYTNVSNLEGYANRANLAWNKANRSVPVHNAFLLTRAELGLHGEVAFVLLLLVPMITGLFYAYRRRGRPLEGQMLGPVVGCGAILVHGQFEFLPMVYTAQLPFLMSVGAMAGLMVAAKRKAPQTVDDRSSRRVDSEPTVALPAVPRLPTIPAPRMMR